MNRPRRKSSDQPKPQIPSELTGLIAGACPYCDYDEPFDVRGIFPEYREIDAIFCCEELREEFTFQINELDEEQWQLFWREFFKAWSADVGGILEAAGCEVRRVLHDSPCDDFTLDFNLTVRQLRPDEQQLAKDFIGLYHRHCEVPCQWLFGHAAFNGLDLVAVSWTARPNARKINRFFTCEVTRLCVRDDLRPELVYNACSMLYAEAAREAERRGYRRIITYTRVSESGASLKAAGWKAKPATTRAGQTWNVESRERKVTEKELEGAEEKLRWTRKLNPPRRMAEALALKAEQDRIQKAEERGQFYLWSEAAA